jgi:hypothetical protein
MMVILVGVVVNLVGIAEGRKAEDTAVDVESSTGSGYVDYGIIDPSSYYQRYRRSDFSEREPFYQWWYFWIKDTER